MSGHHGHAHPEHVKGSWRQGLWILAVLGALAYAATGFYTVKSNERAIVRRFGRTQDIIRESGLHLGLPYGLDRVSPVKATEAKRVGVRMSLADRTLGRKGDPLQAEVLTGDRNLIIVSAVVQYAISDPKGYLFRVADVPALVRGVAASELTRMVSGMSVDEVLIEKREIIRTDVRGAIQAVLNRYGVGVRVTSVSFPSGGVAPPAEVADAFADVTSARGDRERAKNIAEGYANRIEAQSRGEAQRILAEADGYAGELVEKALGDAERFLAEAAELRTHRALTLKRLVLETLEDVLPGMKKVILDPKAGRGLDLGIIESDE